jgi:hypothetical protein
MLDLRLLKYWLNNIICKNVLVATFENGHFSFFFLLAHLIDFLDRLNLLQNIIVYVIVTWGNIMIHHVVWSWVIDISIWDVVIIIWCFLYYRLDVYVFEKRH